jgi:hypothetical protein
VNPTLLLGTKKGAFLIHDRGGRPEIAGPHYLGHGVHHLVADRRAGGGTLLLAAKAGHLGPTVFRSTDRGAHFHEVRRPPAFPKAAAGETGRVVNHVFWLQPSTDAEPGVWYAGTSPPALFRSEDDGETWAPVAGFNDHAMWATWTQEGDDGTPDGSLLHSINVDPRDPAHLYVGCSGGGVFESTDGGGDWVPLNAGCAADFSPDPDPEYGHDPHCMQLHPQDPDVLWQQNHCGIYRMHRPEGRWDRVGRAMPAAVGDIGFPVGLHPRDADTVWVFPMDGTDVWPRTCPAGRAAVYRSRDAGASWTELRTGLPEHAAWLTVYRQGMAVDDGDPVGVHFGTTSGSVFSSRDEGDSWQEVARHLPDVWSVEWMPAD